MKPAINSRIWPISLLFLLVLALPTLDWMFKFDHAPQASENRQPAVWPAQPKNLQELDSYLPRLEAYFNDHFGFRNRLIRWHKRWKKSLFGDVSSSEVLQGRDGWMYFSGGYMIENLQGNRRLSSTHLEQLRQIFEARHQWLQKRGVQYALVIAPNKESIYPEYLPQWLFDNRAALPPLDDFLDYMRQHSTVPVVDPRAALIAAKSLGPVYFRTDSHWNALGSWVALTELSRALHQQQPELPEMLNQNQVDIRTAAGEANSGDLARMLGQEQLNDDLAEVVPHPPLQWLQPRPLADESAEDWAPGTAPVGTQDAQGRFKLLVFHDSFGDFWHPMLGLGYHQAEFVRISSRRRDHGPLDWDAARVVRTRPDVVVDEIVERNLLNLSTESLHAPNLPD